MVFFLLLFLFSNIEKKLLWNLQVFINESVFLIIKTIVYWNKYKNTSLCIVFIVYLTNFIVSLNYILRRSDYIHYAVILSTDL